MNFMQHASIKRAKSFYQSHAETSFNETKSEIEAGLDQLGSLELGGVHKLRLQDLSFFDHLPPLFTLSMV